jgi:hypothetical protein
MSDKYSIQAELSKFRQRIEKAPLVEKEYNELTRDYITTKQKYDETMNRLMTANVAKGIEEGQHGQRFEIKNYAYLPEKPYKPNRLNIILLGFCCCIRFRPWPLSSSGRFRYLHKNREGTEQTGGCTRAYSNIKSGNPKRKRQKNLSKISMGLCVSVCDPYRSHNRQ